MTDIHDLNKMAAKWKAKATTALAASGGPGAELPKLVPYNGARFSPSHGEFAVFSACADAASALETAVNAVKRAMVIEDAVEAGKAAAKKSKALGTDAAIAEEVEAVWYIRDIFNGKDTRAALGLSR